MKGIGASIKKHQKAIGLGMVAAGGAILAAGALSIKTFAEMGDEVHKMALRTGFATESLSRLKYAAEIGGATLGDVEKGFKKMAMSVSDAKDGLATYTREFDKIGINVQELEGLSPEEQFLKIALAIAAVEDPTQRSSSAMKIFGRAGTALLPMLEGGAEGLKEMMAEAEKFAPIFDKEAAAAAAKLTDQMGQLSGATTKVKMVIANQLVPILIPLIDKIRDAIAGISAWAERHPMLTKVIVLGTAALSVLLLVLGGLLLLMPGLTAATALFGVTLSAAIWPVTLLVAGIALLTAGISLLVLQSGAGEKAERKRASATLESAAAAEELEDRTRFGTEAVEEHTKASEELYATMDVGRDWMYNTAIAFQKIGLEAEEATRRIREMKKWMGEAGAVATWGGGAPTRPGRAPVPGAPVYGPPDPETGEMEMIGWEEMQRGGIAMRPMLARIGEKAPEAVIPLDKLEGMIGGGRAVNIFVELDGRVIARAIGQPLVDLIRLKTGLHI